MYSKCAWSILRIILDSYPLFLNRVNQNLIESVKKIVNIELRVPLSLLFLLETIFINVR